MERCSTSQLGIKEGAQFVYLCLSVYYFYMAFWRTISRKKSLNADRCKLPKSLLVRLRLRSRPRTARAFFLGWCIPSAFSGVQTRLSRPTSHPPAQPPERSFITLHAAHDPSETGKKPCCFRSINCLMPQVSLDRNTTETNGSMSLIYRGTVGLKRRRELPKGIANSRTERKTK